MGGRRRDTCVRLQLLMCQTRAHNEKTAGRLFERIPCAHSYENEVVSSAAWWLFYERKSLPILRVKTDVTNRLLKQNRFTFDELLRSYTYYNWFVRWRVHSTSINRPYFGTGKEFCRSFETDPMFNPDIVRVRRQWRKVSSGGHFVEKRARLVQVI